MAITGRIRGGPVGSLDEAVRRGLNLSCECRCGNKAVLCARALAVHYARHGFSTRADQVQHHLYCSRCHSREVLVMFTVAPLTKLAPDRGG